MWRPLLLQPYRQATLSLSRRARHSGGLIIAQGREQVSTAALLTATEETSRNFDGSTRWLAVAAGCGSVMLASAAADQRPTVAAQPVSDAPPGMLVNFACKLTVSHVIC